MTERQKQLVTLIVRETTDHENLDGIEVIQKAENIFHIEYDIVNPFNGFAFDVEITDGEEVVLKTTNSAYGDDGTIVYDHNLNYLRTEA
jgi:hypothetical protein